MSWKVGFLKLLKFCDSELTLLTQDSDISTNEVLFQQIRLLHFPAVVLNYSRLSTEFWVICFHDPAVVSIDLHRCWEQSAMINQLEWTTNQPPSQRNIFHNIWEILLARFTLRIQEILFTKREMLFQNQIQWIYILVESNKPS